MKTKGIYLLYRVLQAFGWPILALYFLWRGVRHPAYWDSLPQRLGFLPHSYRQTGPGAIWLHAVSVGEVLAGLELARRLRSEFPNSRLFVSTSTLAGRALANEKLAGLADVFFAPVDYCFAVRRVLRTLKPSLVVAAETEIWPNLFREVRRIEAGLAIVNGRISDRALPRYLLLRAFFRHVLPAADAILAQSEAMAERFAAIGAPEGLAAPGGNLKYDFEPRAADAASPVRRWIEEQGPARVWIAASTMPPAAPGDPDEDDVAIEAFRTLAARHPGLLLVLVPRKPERFDEAARKLAAAGVRFARRSALPRAMELPGALLLDSIGELSGLFPLADAVFMGGTLASRGGHNILEPAFFARPVVIGPHMENFPEIAAEFRAGGACVEIGSAAELAAATDALVSDRGHAAAIGKRALACARSRRGSTARTVAELRRIYDLRVPRYRPAWPWFPFAWLLAKLWKWGGRRRMRGDVLRRRSLPSPVVSVGNITMGGAGKTPCVLLLAGQLRERGRRPGILSRGYGRSSIERRLAAAPGAKLRLEQTGDEPQIFIRADIAPVGIGADRYETGRLLEERFGVDVLLLDDGFQHIRLTRRIDLVLVDALDPFAGREVFPLGRMREELPGLGRADAFLITRAGYSDMVPAIERTLRRWNERAPIFHGRVAPREWVREPGGRAHALDPPPFERAAAFCGLGNPRSFHATLEHMGVDVAAWAEFDDHHRYRPGELRRMAHLARSAGAEVLVTTGKDAINLCDGFEDLLAPLPLYWLRADLEIDRQDELLALIGRRI